MTKLPGPRDGPKSVDPLGMSKAADVAIGTLEKASSSAGGTLADQQAEIKLQVARALLEQVVPEMVKIAKGDEIPLSSWNETYGWVTVMQPPPWQFRVVCMELLLRVAQLDPKYLGAQLPGSGEQGESFLLFKERRVW